MSKQCRTRIEIWYKDYLYNLTERQTRNCGGKGHENICITAQQRYKGH